MHLAGRLFRIERLPVHSRLCWRKYLSNIENSSHFTYLDSHEPVSRHLRLSLRRVLGFTLLYREQLLEQHVNPTAFESRHHPLILAKCIADNSLRGVRGDLCQCPCWAPCCDLVDNCVKGRGSSAG